MWPRLRRARTPLSRSSAATIAALARQATAIACSRSGQPAATARQFALEPGEEVGVADQAVFRHLGIAGVELARRQRIEDAGVGEHELGLMEDADEVLAAAGVDAGLAADRGIDLREQRRRHLDEAHAAPHDAGGKAGEVADHAAAEGEDDVAALEPRGEQRVDDLSSAAKLFDAFAGRDDDRDMLDAGRSRGTASSARR